MTARSTLSSILSFTALALILPGTAAHAFELEQFGSRLKAVSAEQGTTLTWTELSGDQSQVVVKGAAASVQNGGAPLQIGDVTFSDIAEEGDHYKIGSIDVPGYSFKQQDLVVATEKLSVQGAEVPFDAAASNGMMTYDTASAESASVDVAGKRVLTIRDMAAKSEKSGDVSNFTVTAGRFTSDIFALAGPEMKPTLSELGYETLTGKILMEGSWNTSDGHLMLTKNDFVVDDAGTLGFTFDISGYTPALMKTMRETTEKMASAPQEQQSAQGMAMLGLMQQLTFSEANIRFSDDSLTTKVIGAIAKKQNTAPDALVNQAKAILPFALAQLNMPEFAQSVTSAVNSFLDDPKSIQITAKPAQPLPFAQLAATGMMARGPDAPKAIINQLGIRVTAND